MSYVNKVSEKDMCQRKFHYVCLRILNMPENSTYTLTPNIKFSWVKKPVTYVKDWEELVKIGDCLNCRVLLNCFSLVEKGAFVVTSLNNTH